MQNEPRSFYERHAKEYHNWKYTHGVREFQRVEKQFLRENVLPKSKLIDIGCGPGEHIASILNKECQITAVDFVQEMIDTAKQRVGSGAEFICDDIMHLEFPENHFDYGVCYCTLPNQENYESFFDHMSFFCRSLIISVYDWSQHLEVAEFYKLNGLSPRIDETRKTLFLTEGLRYIFLQHDVVSGMFEKNGFQLRTHSHEFGRIYYGTKNRR